MSLSTRIAHRRRAAAANTAVIVAGTGVAALLAATSVRFGVLAIVAAGLVLLAVALPSRRAAATVLLLPLCLLPHGVQVAALWVSASDVLVVALGALLLAERAMNRHEGRLLGPLTVPAIAFVAWTLASAVWAPDAIGPLVEAIQRFAFVVFGTALVAALPRDGRHMRRMLLAFVGAAAVLGAVTVGTAIAEGRFFGVYAAGMHKNTVGYLLSFAFVAGVALIVAWPDDGRAPRWVRPASALILVGLALSGSRGAWVGVVAALVLMLAMRRPHLAPVVTVSGVVLLALLVLLVPPDLATERAGFDTPHSTAAVRAETWQGGIDTIASAPLLGVGAGNFTTPVHGAGSQVDPNNLLLLTWAETGIVGLLLLLTLLTGTLALGWRQARTLPARGTPMIASLAGIGILVAAVAHAQFDMFWTRGVALATFMGVGMIVWAEQAARRAASEASATPALLPDHQNDAG